MKLADKLQAFCQGRLRVDHPLEKTALEFQASSNLRGCFFEAGSKMQSQLIQKKPSVFCGAYSYMNPQGYVRSNTFIGRYCSIGRRVSLGAGSHRMSGLSTHPLMSRGPASANYDSMEIAEHNLVFERERVARTVVMNDIWVGDGAIILQGVTIGTGAVIGGNSMVTNDIPPYAIVGGIPARIIRYRFPEAIIEMLLASEWWEADPEYLRQCPIGNVLAFLQSYQADQSRKQVPFKTFALRSLPAAA